MCVGRVQVRYLSFSAHADVKGILQLVAAAAPRCVVLVHGEKSGMDFLASRITWCVTEIGWFGMQSDVACILHRPINCAVSTHASGGWPAACAATHRWLLLVAVPLCVCRSMGVPCMCPANGDWCRVKSDPTPAHLKLRIGPDWTQPVQGAAAKSYAEDTGEEVLAFPQPVNSMFVSGVVVAKQAGDMAVEPALLKDAQFGASYNTQQPRFQVQYKAG